VPMFYAYMSQLRLGSMAGSIVPSIGYLGLGL
jgi:hypothetical protein